MLYHPWPLKACILPIKWRKNFAYFSSILLVFIWRKFFHKVPILSIELDKVDRKILALLQQDSTLSLNDLAEAVNLTTTPCWKRLKKLEESGVIEKRVALLNPDKLNLSFTAFVLVKTSDHSHEWYTHFVSTQATFLK